MRKFILAGAVVSLSLMSFQSFSSSDSIDTISPEGCGGGSRVCTANTNLNWG